MKKFSILGLCLFAGFTMSAQMDLMKDVERTVKSGNFSYTDLKPQLDQITQNAETKDNVKAWKLAGEAAFANYVSDLDKAKPVIICGDLNVAHNEIDLKNPKSNRGSAGFSD